MQSVNPAVTPDVKEKYFTSSGLYALKIGYTSSFIVFHEQIIIIDIPSPEYTGHILRIIGQGPYSEKDIALIIATHGHTDHFGGIGAFKKQLSRDVPVVVHEDDRVYLARGINPPLSKVLNDSPGLSAILRERYAGLQVDPVENVLAIRGDNSLDDFGIRGQILHTPGHSPGSLSVLLAGGDAVVGDLISSRFFNTKIPGLPLFAVDYRQIRMSADRVLSFKPRRIHVSHGSVYHSQTISQLWAAEKEESK